MLEHQFGEDPRCLLEDWYMQEHNLSCNFFLSSRDVPSGSSRSAALTVCFARRRLFPERLESCHNSSYSCDLKIDHIRMKHFENVGDFYENVAEMPEIAQILNIRSKHYTVVAVFYACENVRWDGHEFVPLDISWLTMLNKSSYI